MLHNLDGKNLHINELIFFQNPKNPIFRVFLNIISKMRFFPKNLVPLFFTLTLWEFLTKFYEPLYRKKVYLLTYWNTESDEIIGTVFVYRWVSNNLATKNFLDLLEFQESWNVIGQD